MSKIMDRTMFRFDAKPIFGFDLARHDVRSTLPAAVQAIMQNGLLERVFEDALVPDFLYPKLADERPWAAGMGDTSIFTRAGLLAPTTTPITGSDPSPTSYAIEQYSMTMDQYGMAMDTSMIQSRMSLASKFMEDVQKLGVSAAQSINRLARTRLYNAYGGGRTWAPATAGTSTSIPVFDATGFDKVLVNGVKTAVSGSNPLTVTIAGVANTVTGCNLGTNTLTVGTTTAVTAGDPVVAANAAVSFRPAARASAFQLTGSDVATMSLFRSAVARLRKMNVPTINGNYIAHIDPDTESQLYADSDFKQAYQGRGDSAVFRDMSIGTFLGIDWVRNIEAPTLTVNSNLVHRPIVFGGGTLVAGPFDGMADLLADTGVEQIPSVRFIGPAQGVQVALIVRPPQDRLQQVIGSAWSWIGDYAVPSDSTTGDAALFKRGVIIEHV
jgi:hypothetical protein